MDKSKEQILDAIATAFWECDVEDEIKKLKDIEEFENIRPYNMGNPYITVFMLYCLELFGDTGVSPNNGWIRDIEGFRNYIDEITKMYRDWNGEED